MVIYMRARRAVIKSRRSSDQRGGRHTGMAKASRTNSSCNVKPVFLELQLVHLYSWFGLYM
jgi:hypothetical protein